jgi:hypothetical protein
MVNERDALLVANWYTDSYVRFVANYKNYKMQQLPPYFFENADILIGAKSRVYILVREEGYILYYDNIK